MPMQAVANNACPPYPEEAAERYVMKWMSGTEAKQFETHMTRCAGCAQAVSEMQFFAGMLRAALSEAMAR